LTGEIKKQQTALQRGNQQRDNIMRLSFHDILSPPQKDFHVQLTADFEVFFSDFGEFFVAATINTARFIRDCRSGYRVRHAHRLTWNAAHGAPRGFTDKSGRIYKESSSARR
jgi:hypothetical protein